MSLFCQSHNRLNTYVLKPYRSGNGTTNEERNEWGLRNGEWDVLTAEMKRYEYVISATGISATTRRRGMVRLMLYAG